MKWRVRHGWKRGRYPARKAVVGVGRGTRLALVVLILLESIPVSGALEIFFEDQLRVASAAGAEAIARVVGLDVAREGTTLFGRHGRLEVFPPCAGGKVLAMTVACGCVAVALSRRSRRRRFAVFLILPLAGLGANALRVSVLFATGIADPRFHDLMGLVAFSIVALGVARAAGLGAKEVRPCSVVGGAAS